ncbi:MAG: glycosyltransferase family 4 protein [Candidatus Eiseniibacteriota bacterium]
MKHYSIAAVLPGMNVFGGVRRYLQLGNVWAAWGHRVTLYTPDGLAPAWFRFGGEVRRFDEAPKNAPAEGAHDLAFTPEPPLLPVLRALPAVRRAFYVAVEGGPHEGEALRDRELLVYAVSGALRRALSRRWGRPILDGAGAVDAGLFRPRPIERDPRAPVVLAFGRRSRPRKGTALVVAAAEQAARRVPGLRLELFDHVGPGNERDPRAGFEAKLPWHYTLNPSQEELAALYARADVFVAAERKAGWCNTAIEALASGCPLVCTTSGTGDFARHGETARVVRIRHPFFLAREIVRVLEDPGMRERMSRAGRNEALRHGWPALAGRILAQAGLADGVRDDVAIGAVTGAGA